METDTLQTLARLLLYGSPNTRRQAAERFLEEADPACWALLAETVRSEEPWLLRARCLEALGVAAGQADEPTVRIILTVLLEGSPSPLGR